MNDSNKNNTFGNNNINDIPPQSNTPQENNTINSTSEVDNSTVQPQINNSVFGSVAPNTSTSVNEVSQPGQNISQQQTVNSQIDNNINTTSDEELLKAFIGDKYEKITTKQFNLAAFFFATFYIFYRKLFVYALLALLFNLISLIIIQSFIPNLAFSVFSGLLFNKIYVLHAKKKISRIKLGNPQKDINELKSICSTNGGTSVGQLFLGFLIEAVILGIVVIFSLAFGFGSLLFNLGKKTNSSLNGTYDGVFIVNDSIDMKNEFSITVPTQFENNSDYYKYEYEYSSGNGVFNKCSVNLYVPTGFSDSENLLKQIVKYNSKDKTSSITKSSINNVDWHWFSLDDAFGRTYYYGTTKNNKVFLLQYEINEDAASDCESYRNLVINSIRNK